MDYAGSHLTCSGLFDQSDIQHQRNTKNGFLFTLVRDKKYVQVPGNGPLNMILCEFMNQVLNVLDPLTHVNVLALFESALSREDWPRDDVMKPFNPEEKPEHGTGSFQPKHRSSAPKRPAPNNSEAKQQQKKARKDSPFGLRKLANARSDKTELPCTL
ncbi:hypothetical protein AMATHDRAFT_10381 [Amanita thiersii Skay4041]|uniref:Uncharacterized protein n=1 Tax=Amanita thiersii Skay4041 TaxID=703135 RepID=A0A2A9N9R9_9AGAR|nr:hypothetical protein AMATHDRAFT_10381 [Amanita thiersii Skay4041]